VANSEISDPLLIKRNAAREIGVSIPTFDRCVAQGWLPAPVYPAPRAPRWRRSELLAALEKTRALPREAKERRRQKKLAEIRAGT
jgi:predicted DNA-binding transcriptional regulator AlpA